MTKIQVICGFLESGKTTLLQRLLEQDYMASYRRVLIMQCEEGEREFHAASMKNQNIVLEKVDRPEKLCTRLFYKIRAEVNPDLILIEYNGTWPMERLLGVRLPSGYELDRVLFCADASTFELYLKNTGGMMAEQLSNADAVLFNRCPRDCNALRANARSASRTAELSFDSEAEAQYLAGALKPEEIRKQAKSRLRSRIFTLASLLLLCLIFIRIPAYGGAYDTLKSVNMVFLGILLEALPFLLIGAFVSALLQVFVPDEALVRLFTRHRWLGYPIAVLLGFFFPVCDCGIVPIASRLTQKGVPLPQAMVFMLAAPAVSPVTILSTLYAFPGQPRYALYRIALGVLVALAAGLVLGVSGAKSAGVLLPSAGAGNCCPPAVGKSGSVFESIFRTAGTEFLNMGRYIIAGAFVCAVLQQVIPAALFQSRGTSLLIPLLIMIPAAFILSVCSTSNAFIGRSFLNVFPASAVMGFIVMGPMLDLSNLFLMGANFRKKFIARLAITLLVIAFPLFWLFAELLKGGRL